jgi:mannose-1-phosphate guanylyltransferase
MRRPAETPNAPPCQAVLLVGGRGTRMWPLTAAIPKGLLPLGGLPFVEYQLRQLAGIGVTEVVLAVGRPLVEAWEDFAAGAPEGISVRLSVEDEPLDTAGSVRAVLDSLDDRFFVLNGDVVLEADLTAVAAGPGAFGSIGLVEVEDTSAYGVVVIGSDGLVEEFVEKPSSPAAPARTVSAGVYVLDRQALAPYPTGPLSFERVVFPDLVARRGLGAAVLQGEWMDIGTPARYLDTHETVMTGGSRINHPPSPHVGPPGGIVGGRWTWIASDAMVAPGARVEESVVLGGAVIEEGAVVRRSVIGPGARVASGAVVSGDSLIGPGAVVGSGCELDNGVRLAPDAVLPPGTIRFSPPE